MDNLKLYHALRRVPDDAKRPIQAGRLKGKTDINPMWRLKSLTEQFGPCGIGWKYVIEQQWMEPGSDGEMAAFCNISLYIKDAEGQWSDAIPGTGGSTFVAKERSGLYTSDECYKMALTDAISVACKALGMGADVYWDADRTKYTDMPSPALPQQGNPRPSQNTGFNPQQPTAPPPAAPPVAPAGKPSKVVDLPELQQPAYEYIVESVSVQNGMSSQSTTAVLKDSCGKSVKVFARGVHEDLKYGVPLVNVKISLKKQGTVAFHYLKSYEVAGTGQCAA